MNLMQPPGQASRPSPFISINHVTKSFGDFKALNDVSLDIDQGELFCLVGASGCGKSTLLRILAGFESPSAGQVIIDGMDMANVKPYQRPVNMMFQSYALFPHMSVEKNIAYGLKNDKLTRGEINQRVDKMLDMVQLQGFGKRKPQHLSGGQQQRVALARSLAKQPKVLLLDEPLGALDKKLRDETQFELINIQQQLGVTFVVVTHDQDEAMILSSRIGVMSHGQLIQTGTPNGIYEKPNSRFVADFIGSANLLDGHVTEVAQDRLHIHCDQTNSQLQAQHTHQFTQGAKVAIAIRSEKIKLSRQAPISGDNLVQGVVREVAYMGDLSVYRVVLASGQKIDVTSVNLDAETEQFSSGDTVFMSWKANTAVVLAP